MKPDPYLVWQDVRVESRPQRRPSLRLVSGNEPAGAELSGSARAGARTRPTRTGLVLESTLDQARPRRDLDRPVGRASRCPAIAGARGSGLPRRRQRRRAARPSWGQREIPLIAMIGHESPSRLQQAFELLPSALLLKPVRPSGVYTAIFFAVNGHARDRQQAKAVAEPGGAPSRAPPRASRRCCRSWSGTASTMTKPIGACARRACACKSPSRISAAACSTRAARAAHGARTPGRQRLSG